MSAHIESSLFIPSFLFPSIPNLLLHVRTRIVRLRAHGLALDSLSARVVLAGVLADAGGTGV